VSKIIIRRAIAGSIYTLPMVCEVAAPTKTHAMLRLNGTDKTAI
jgi:hypothetical protein